MPPPSNITALFALAQGGCPVAAKALLDQYGRYVRVVVRRRLDPRLRKRFDSVDVVQDVWASFFAHGAGREDLRDDAAIKVYLARMADTRVRELFRHHLGTGMRDMGREEPIAGLEAEPPARGPTPSTLAAAEDRWQALTRGLPPEQVAMLRLVREGHTHEEVAGRLGVSAKTVQRLIRAAERRLPPEAG